MPIVLEQIATEHTSYRANFSCSADEKVHIVFKVKGEEIWNAQVPDNKRWNVVLNVQVTEFNK